MSLLFLKDAFEKESWPPSFSPRRQQPGVILVCVFKVVSAPLPLAAECVLDVPLGTADFPQDGECGFLVWNGASDLHRFSSCLR